MLRAPLRLALLLAAALCAPSAARAGGAAQVETIPIRFAPGAASATVEGRLSGWEVVDHRIGLEAGQGLSAEMETDNPSAYFNVIEPGPGDAALFVGSIGGLAFETVAARSGYHRIRVYLMRNAARRSETARYRLTVGVDGAPDLSAPVEGDVADGLMGGPDFWAVSVASGRLNLRAAPSTGAAVLDRLPRGAALRNLGCRMAEGRRWCRVETDGVEGWAAGAYLAEGPGG